MEVSKTTRDIIHSVLSRLFQAAFLFEVVGEKMNKEVLESLLRQRDELAEKIKKKQIKFCEFYIATGFNGAEAARLAGYSEKSARQIASKLLTNVDIAAYTRVLQKIAVEKSGLNADLITLERLDILRKCKGGEPVKEWDYEKHEYVEKGVYKMDAKNALKALDALDKTVTKAEGRKTGDILIKFESSEGEKWSG